MQKILWNPTDSSIKSSSMYKFMQYVNNKYELNILDYSSLHTWSVNYPKDFWGSLAKFCNIKFSQRHTKVISNNNDMIETKWFTDAKLSFAENLLCNKSQATAIIACDENLKTTSLSYNELSIAVAKFANALLERGIKPKDRIVGIISNIPEAVVAMLAANSIGAIWSACSPEFGIEAIYNRFEQITPKLLITNVEYQYNGKIFDNSNKLSSILNKIPSIKTVVNVSNIPFNSHVNCEIYSYQSFLSSNSQIEFYQAEFDHPLYILYSSGTTGKPKCIVHGAGGTLLQHSKELILHTNITNNNVVFYYSSVGWMMWNWLISSLKVGACIVLYNGSPIFSKPSILFDLIDHTNISVFGISAKYLALLEQMHIKPFQSHSLKSLKTILSTGSPLSKHSFDYVYKHIKPDVCLSSISGGTDIISCFALGNPMKPVIRGELQCLGLGMDIKVYNSQQQSITNELGELVCTKPFPSRPIYFWNDKDHLLYKKSYYSFFPNIWRHGDYAMITSNEGLIISGRSDTTLNPGGVRIGTAEIYQLLEKMPSIKDSVIIGRNVNNDVELILFIVLNRELKLNEEIIKEIKLLIKDSLSPKHVPHHIFQVRDIPRTYNDKKVESSLKNIFNGQNITNLEALVEPNVLDEYYQIYNSLNT